MFVEGEVEIHVKDRATVGLDAHEMKLWVQRAFRNVSCYRISEYSQVSSKVVRAVVAIKVSQAGEGERKTVEENPGDLGLLRAFIERMFDGKGRCRCVGDPTIKSH